MADDRALIASVWEQHRPAMLDRVALIERSQIDPRLRDRAREAAHQIAGTAGTFGFPEASELARKCERLLASEAAAWEMSGWVAGIRAEFEEDAAAAADSTPDREPELSALPFALIITDDADLGSVLRIGASRHGLRARAVRSAQADVELDRGEVAALLVDLSAGEAGHTLADLHRDRPELPVVAMRGSDVYSARLEAVADGAVGYLDTDATPAEILDQLALAIAERTTGHGRVLVVGAPELRARLADDHLDAVDGGWEDLPTVRPAVVVLGPAALDLRAVLRADRRWSRTAVIVGGDDAEALSTRVKDHLERARARVARVGIDAETGLPDRRTSAPAISNLIRMGERLERAACVALIDAGDEDPARLGDRLRRTLRAEDVVARWDGGTFVVCLFGATRNDAIDRIAGLLDDTDACAAVAQYPTDGANLTALHESATEALRTARPEGRRRVVSAGRTDLITQLVDVAIIEDEDATSEVIQKALTGHGLRCFRFSNGAGAVEMLLGEEPRVRARVILLDLNLPAVSGMELLAAFASEGLLRSAQVIVVSASNDPATIARAKALGATDYLVKPIDLGGLVDYADRALGRKD